tara:strand:- start:2018 stop:2524 length:507 start_codon:yes stop_codon:yes gene_type:complete
MTDRENFQEICDLTTAIAGFKKDSLRLKSRKQNLQVARMVASMIARLEEGISHSVIAKVLLRHRTLIYHYEKMHPGNFMWKKYRDLYKKVHNAYRQIDSHKKTFLDKNYMKRFLKKNGVSESRKAEVYILVKSGAVGCLIATSFMDFSNQLENIKVALKEYKYRIEIK